MVTVLLADDNAIVRVGILRLLAEDPRIQVVGNASDFSEALSKANKLRPDVLILDLHMPVRRGLSASDLKRELNSCGARVLGISFANDDGAKSLARSFGAVELVDKMNMWNELVPAILKLAFARGYRPPTVPTKPSGASELQ